MQLFVGVRIRLGAVALAILANALCAAPDSLSTCAPCHPQETTRYAGSPMGRSLDRPSVVTDGRVVHTQSGSSITIRQGAGRMTHRLEERGLSAEYPLAYQIGAGKLAYSYVVELNGYLFESPATWFRSYGWDVSPGYQSAAAIDFDRPINQTCLFCHAGAADFGADGRRLLNPPLTAITCERCHGPSADHLRNPSAANIVNPEKLPRRARDSICEQCHLEGAARVLNPGRTWRDFHPGDNLENTAAVYVVAQNSHETTPVSQVEQLAESRCAAASAGRLWCGTCHDPHGTRDVRAVCQSCHVTLSTGPQHAAPSECVTCHMPHIAAGYAHVAVTDHRIVRRPAPAPPPRTGSPSLTAWVEPPAALRRRDLIVASLTAGGPRRLPGLARSGLKLLEGLPKSQSDTDAGLLAAACDATQSLDFCRRAAALRPESADRAMALGIALARSGDLTAAETHLRNAIALDTSLKHAYIELWTVYERQKKTARMADLADRFLKWNSQNIMFRILKSDLAAQAAQPRF